MKEIDRDTYLKAKGLFHLAQEHLNKASEYEKALSELFGYGSDYAGHISDALSENQPLEPALEKEGIKVRDDGPVC